MVGSPGVLRSTSRMVQLLSFSILGRLQKTGARSPNHITLLKEKHITTLDALLVELSMCLKEKRVPASLQDFDLGDSVKQGLLDRRSFFDTPAAQFQAIKPVDHVLRSTETEEVFYAWDRLEEKVPATAFTPLWRQQETEPEREVPQQVQEQQFVWESTERVAPARGHFVRNVLIISILIACLIVGLILLLLATHSIAFSSATFYPASLRHPGLIQHTPYISSSPVSTLSSHSSRL